MIPSAPPPRRSPRQSMSVASPNTLMWPWKVVTSLPRIGMIPSGQASTSRWWLIVLWSVIARKSSPRSTAPRTRPSTVTSPSLWTVCEWRSPRYQRAPPAAGRPGARDDGRSTGRGDRRAEPGRHLEVPLQVTGFGAIREDQARVDVEDPRSGRDRAGEATRRCARLPDHGPAVVVRALHGAAESRRARTASATRRSPGARSPCRGDSQRNRIRSSTVRSGTSISKRRCWWRSRCVHCPAWSSRGTMRSSSRARRSGAVALDEGRLAGDVARRGCARRPRPTGRAGGARAP